MFAKIVSLILAISFTASLGYYVPSAIDHFNDATFSNVTILDTPSLLKALRDVQSMGVLICLHGWRHEDFSTLNASEARQDVEMGLQVFQKADFSPTVFIPPYKGYDVLPPSIRAAIESTGIATSLPVLKTNGSFTSDYGWMWRTMTSFADHRFNETLTLILEQRPTTITMHVEDWNPYLKQLISDYLQETDRVNVTIRIDDFEVNTPVEEVYDAAKLLNYSAVGLVAYAVIPAGTWRNGDPTIYGVSVNGIFNAYWVFFLVTALFPFCFLLFLRGLSRDGNGRKKRDCGGEDPPLGDAQRERQLVSIIVPAYNEEAGIGRCIEAILKQDFVGSKEIIIVNDGSTDRTREIASKYPVKVMDIPINRGKAFALNAGIQVAKGNIMIFSDADSELSANAVTSLVNCFEENPNAEVVAGNVFIRETNGGSRVLRDFQKIEYRMEQEVSRYLQSVNGNVVVCPGPLFAVRRCVIKEIRFNDKTVVEDAEFTVEALRKSVKIIRFSEANVYTDAPSSLESWLNQKKRWWYGNLQVWRINNHWAQSNPWMILNYFSFPASFLSIVMMVMLPYLFSTYDNTVTVLLRGILYIIAPWILFTALTIPIFARKNKKLILMLVPYYVIYATLKMIVLCYLYICYLTRRGVTVRYGPREIRVK